MKPVYFVTMMIACMSAFAENIEPLNSNEVDMLNKLEILQWQSELSEQEMEFVTNALVSSKDTIAEAALCAAIVHDFHDLRETLRQGVGPANGYGRLLASVVADGLEKGRRPIESLRRSNLLESVPENAKGQIGQKAGHIVAVMTARMFRLGEMPEIDASEFTFNPFDQKLLLYSKYPAAEAKEKIIQTLAQATIASENEHDLISVLASYEDVSLDSMVSAFENEKTGEYGKLLLVRAIEKRASRLTNSERQKAKSVFGKHYAGSKRIERAVQRLFGELEKPQAGDFVPVPGSVP